MAHTSTARRELIARLVIAQNRPVNQNVDILTITGFMDDEQVAKHLAYYETNELRPKGAR
jgi:hypothetical protein